MDKFVVLNKRNESQNSDGNIGESSEKRARIDTKTLCVVEDIIIDPALRKPITDYEPGIRDDVRRKYQLRGPCQPISDDFPRTRFGNNMRCFQIDWFKKWEWLEYSVSHDAAFCLWCYLFGDKKVGDDVFKKKGFRNWKKATEKFKEHIGTQGSAHNNARILYFAFKEQGKSVAAYNTHLTATVDVIRLLLRLGLTFRSNNESPISILRGNFLELFSWYSSRNVDVGKVVKDKELTNHQFTSPKFLKQIVSACASETTKVIIGDIGDKFFSLLLDDVSDNSAKWQMAVVVRYVNNHGEVVERFVEVVHVNDTTTLSLKSAIDNFFAKHGLLISKVRGQGYNGTSNMRSELNGLKTLILNENPYANYVHCFAHKLHLFVVAVAERNQFVSDFFDYVALITNMIDTSCKRKGDIRQKQHENMVESLEHDEKGSLAQETSLARSGDTHWGSYYKTILRLLSMWSSVVDVLMNIYDDESESKSKGKVVGLIDNMEKYEFVFIAHLMKVVLGLTNSLSQFLQQKDQNIVEAMSLVSNVKRQLQDLRENGWDDLLVDVSNFCSEHDIIIPIMEDNVPGRIRCRHAGHAITYFHHFRVQIFSEVVDHIGQEMENRFSELSTELLLCIACLDPKNSFSNFSLSRVLRLAEIYHDDFSLTDQMELKEELKIWISEMIGNEAFSKLQNIGDLAKKMVEVGFHTSFPLVYLLIELVLVLPIATASVERVFSAMNFIKTNLRNKVGDDLLSDCLVCYVEKEVFTSIDNEVIIWHFQNRL